MGTDTIKLRDRSGEKFLYSRNMIAVQDKKKVLAIGDDAYEMYEKNPVNVEVSCPMVNGVIASATNMELVFLIFMRNCSLSYPMSINCSFAIQEKYI